MSKRTVLTILAIVITPLFLLVLTLALYPSIAMLQPAYKDAEAICDSITVGMTYDDVKNKVGYLLFPTPMTYFDNQGNGQAQLKNDVKGLDATCFISFKNGKVISSGMTYGWL